MEGTLPLPPGKLAQFSQYPERWAKDVLVVSTARLTLFEDLVMVDDSQARFTEMPENLVFLPPVASDCPSRTGREYRGGLPNPFVMLALVSSP
jgi:hypothetical protein